MALAIAFVPALFFYPAMRLGRGVRAIVVALLVAVILSAPLVIAADARFPRLLAGVVAVMPAVKLWDLHRGGQRSPRPTWLEFLLYLPNPFNIVWRKVAVEPPPPPRADMLRVAFGALGSAGALAVCYAVFAEHWKQLPFALEHCTKASALFLVILVFANTAAAAYRLVGIPSTDFSGNFFLARTPAEFWRLYNRPAGQFLHEDVFKAVGGTRSAAVAAMATFAVSGLIHEYLFDIAAGRVQGYQMAFFLIQGAAAIATAQLRPTGWRAVACILATLAFNLATSLLFFASVNETMPFYVRR